MSWPERWEPLVRPFVALCKRDCVFEKRYFNTFLISYKSFLDTKIPAGRRRGSQQDEATTAAVAEEVPTVARGRKNATGGGGASRALGFMAGPRLLQGFSRALGRDGQGGEDRKEHPVPRVPCSAGPDKGGCGSPRRRHQKSDNINGTLTSRASLRPENSRSRVQPLRRATEGGGEREG